MARRGFPNDGDEFEKLDVEGESESGVPEGGGGLPPAIQEKIDAMKKGSLSILKLVLGLSFMTFVYSSTAAFINELGNIDRVRGRLFLRLGTHESVSKRAEDT